MSDDTAVREMLDCETAIRGIIARNGPLEGSGLSEELFKDLEEKMRQAFTAYHYAVEGWVRGCIGSQQTREGEHASKMSEVYRT